MERFDFHPQERDFVAEPSHRYIGQLPECMIDNSLPDDVARVALFQFAERNGATLRLWVVRTYRRERERANGSIRSFNWGVADNPLSEEITYPTPVRYWW